MNTKSRIPRAKAAALKCISCGAPTLTRGGLCTACKATADEKELLKYREVTLRSDVVYEVTRYGRPPETCGQLCEMMIGLLSKGPPYVRERDLTWLMVMLQDLRDFTPQRGSYADPGSASPFRSLPISLLERGLHEWVTSSFSSSNPLLSTYRLGACEFIASHAFGERFWEHDARIAPLLEESGRKRFFDESTFKAEMTRNHIGGRVALFRAPEDVRLSVDLYEDGKTRAYELAREHILRIERCHLSLDSQSDYTQVKVEETSETKLDLMRGFCFFGQIGLGSRIHEHPTWTGMELERKPTLHARIPITWIKRVSKERCYEYGAWPVPDIALPEAWFAAASK